MSGLRYIATIEINKINPYVLVIAKNAKTLKPGWKKPMPVLVQINGKPDDPWRINIMPVGNGDFYLYLHSDVRKESNTKVGDKVKVNIAFNSKYRNGPMHPVPLWFSNPLNKNIKAKEAWSNLIPSRKKEILRYFSQLKSDEARQRNVQKALLVLSGEKGRFMARSWKEGK